MATRTRTPPDIHSVAFVSLGCPKNLIDSEKMLGLLAQHGLTPTGDEQAADAIVVNTCGFLEASKEESIDVINEAAERKKDGSLKRLIVAGCLVQRHRAKLLEWCPDIDALVGVFDRDRIAEAVRGPRDPAPGAVASATTASTATTPAADDAPVYSSIAATAALRKQRDHIDAAGYFESDAARLRLTPRHYAYLRISEGCNQNCAFCTIPSIRGKMRSKPLEPLIAEARELFNDGAFELNLIGQDTTSYGRDIGYAPGLTGMLAELDGEASSHGGAWLRLMYAYPSCFTDAMIDTLAGLPHVVKYIDMPLQHINDRVLDSMRRKTSRRLIETLLGKLRDRARGITIRTTFITGYPGETDAEHEELVQFIRDFGFDAMGVFGYSPEPGTPAGTAHADGQAVPEDVIDQRIEELMLAQQDVAFAANAALVQRQAQVEVLIDAAVEQQGQTFYAGRTQAQAPDIDGATYVISDQPLSPGEVVRCHVTDWRDYDLVATPIVA